MASNDNTVAASDQSNSSSTPVGYTKSKKFLGFKIKSKPIYDANAAPPKQVKPIKEPKPPKAEKVPHQKNPTAPAVAGQKVSGKKSKYITNILNKKRGLADSLKEAGVKEEPYIFVKRMIISSIAVAAIIGILIGYVLFAFTTLSSEPAVCALIAFAVGMALYNILFNKFVSYPLARNKAVGKQVERDILFAARDLVISMRSGMPLFNAMTAVSEGYGAASVEFARIVSLVQLGAPIEQAIDEVTAKTNSKTFNRIMLQAAVSIKVGADVTGAIQGVVDDIMQERAIDLRRYGQKLNAIAMFYMLFGIIFPSMGVAIAVIMSTFISILDINVVVLIAVLFAVVCLQLIFLNLIKNSRPTFAA